MSAQREAFEAHATTRDMSTDKYKTKPTAYYWSATHEAWIAWQAAQAAMQAELAQLRGFAVDVMGAWPDGDIDGSDLQDMAVEHGLLTAATVHQPCAGPCGCVDYVSDEQFDAGVECYRKSQVLLDAEIARNAKEAL